MNDLVSLCPVCVPEKPQGIRISDVHCHQHGLELLEKSGYIEPQEQKELDEMRRAIIRHRIGDAVIFGLVLFFGTYLGYHVYRWANSPLRSTSGRSTNFRQVKTEPVGARLTVGADALPVRSEGERPIVTLDRQARKRSRAGTDL